MSSRAPGAGLSRITTSDRQPAAAHRQAEAPRGLWQDVEIGTLREGMAAQRRRLSTDMRFRMCTHLLRPSITVAGIRVGEREAGSRPSPGALSVADASGTLDQAQQDAPQCAPGLLRNRVLPIRGCHRVDIVKSQHAFPSTIYRQAHPDAGPHHRSLRGARWASPAPTASHWRHDPLAAAAATQVCHDVGLRHANRRRSTTRAVRAASARTSTPNAAPSTSPRTRRQLRALWERCVDFKRAEGAMISSQESSVGGLATDSDLIRGCEGRDCYGSRSLDPHGELVEKWMVVRGTNIRQAQGAEESLVSRGARPLPAPSRNSKRATGDVPPLPPPNFHHP